MINKEMAADYLARALGCLCEARAALRRNDAPGTVRRSQEALELAVKALLRALAIEYPRAHDVSDALLEHQGRLPRALKARVEELARLVADLASVRGPAFYGYEREGIPASRAFKLDYAQEVYGRVRRFVKLIERCLRPFIA
ncbi:MAG: hypothetical protein DRJ97_07175 [Thermoprotei archaeon]|nr:MAG: hypothetical protein DRJ69_00480 [Thermoprotei archaeon]RLF13912.1 MAG: hypothetical protein DRJ97_07175 [Thermoprotei archaeon]